MKNCSLFIQGNRATPQTIIETLRKCEFTNECVENPEDIYYLQETIRKINLDIQKDKGEFYESIEVKELDKNKAKSNKHHNWTIRHYSVNNEHDEICSALKLSLTKRKTIHTEGKDWTDFGNMGNVFFYLCLDGNMINPRGFTKDCKYYAEYDLGEMDHVWISNDWLSMKSETQDRVLKGSGEDMCNYLSSLIGKARGEIATKIISNCYPLLEIKVPHSVHVSKWKMV